jgi:hypothetical protein
VKEKEQEGTGGDIFITVAFAYFFLLQLVILLSDVRYYSASSLGPFRSQCAYAGADPCGKPQQKNNDNTHIYINKSSSYITIIILLSDNSL